jgi:N-acylneuraminate cytidylyltransferase/CMP-N,N'-diacetyllegionaminic acid synthase
MTSICTILARGGSKGVPGKNIRPLAGKSLIVWSVEQAKAAELFELIAVSSDSPEILAAGRSAGAHLLVERPPEMATDTASKLPAIRHCALAAEARLGHTADLIVDLQPTSPLRVSGDIVAAVSLLTSTGAESVITGQPSKCPPYFSLVEERGDGTVEISKKLAQPLVRRQDAPRCYDMNGSIYVWSRLSLIERPSVFYASTRLLAMPEERSVDIDSETDFLIADFLMRRRLRATPGRRESTSGDAL